MLKFKIISIFLILVLLITVPISAKEKDNKLILGGSYLTLPNYDFEFDKKVDNYDQYSTFERFFRPSSMPILNDKIEKSLYPLYGSKTLDLDIPSNFLKTSLDTIIHYYSVLREAANPISDTNTGCGSLGDGKGPYPVAYNFLSNDYKKRVSYDDYVNSFKNKLHINLIKLNEVPKDKDRPNELKYFVELETIEGTNEKKGVFSYYYGYIYLTKENGVYKINDMNFAPENYLCAPYHSWFYYGESIVEIEYGGWCSLVDGDVSIKKNGYEKKVYFNDKKDNEYYVLFYEITNGYDIKIADYKKDKDGNWNLIYFNPEKCLENKGNKK